MLKLAACDDEKNQLEAIHRAAKLFFADSQASPYCVTDFSSADELLRALDSGEKFSIALLDICMPGIDGVHLAREIVRRSPLTKIIFVTASTDYAVEAFAVGAVHYLVKPFSQEDFALAMERALSQLPEHPNKIVITGEHGKTSVVLSNDIICVESIGYKRIVSTKNGTLTEVRRTLRDFLSELNRLSPGQFILPYRGYVINLSEVRTVLPLHIEMEGGIRIPLKRGDYNSIKNTLFDYSFVGGGTK